MEPTSEEEDGRQSRGLARFWPVHGMPPAQRNSDDDAGEGEARPEEDAVAPTSGVPSSHSGPKRADAGTPPPRNETQMMALGSRRAWNGNPGGAPSVESDRGVRDGGQRHGGTPVPGTGPSGSPFGREMRPDSRPPFGGGDQPRPPFGPVAVVPEKPAPRSPYEPPFAASDKPGSPAGPRPPETPRKLDAPDAPGTSGPAPQARDDADDARTANPLGDAAEPPRGAAAVPPAGRRRLPDEDDLNREKADAGQPDAEPGPKAGDGSPNGRASVADDGAGKAGDDGRAAGTDAAPTGARRLANLEDADAVAMPRAGRRAAEAVGTPLRPGDVNLVQIAVWDDDAIAHFRSRWHEVKADFVDDPVAAVTRAHDLLTDAVNELTESLLAERDELDPLRGTPTPDTESMRMAMRGYRDFLDRILAL